MGMTAALRVWEPSVFQKISEDVCAALLATLGDRDQKVRVNSRKAVCAIYGREELKFMKDILEAKLDLTERKRIAKAQDECDEAWSESGEMGILVASGCDAPNGGASRKPSPTPKPTTKKVVPRKSSIPIPKQRTPLNKLEPLAPSTNPPFQNGQDSDLPVPSPQLYPTHPMPVQSDVSEAVSSPNVPPNTTQALVEPGTAEDFNGKLSSPPEPDEVKPDGKDVAEEMNDPSPPHKNDAPIIKEESGVIESQLSEHVPNKSMGPEPPLLGNKLDVAITNISPSIVCHPPKIPEIRKPDSTSGSLSGIYHSVSRLSMLGIRTMLKYLPKHSETKVGSTIPFLVKCFEGGNRGTASSALKTLEQLIVTTEAETCFQTLLPYLIDSTQSTKSKEIAIRIFRKLLPRLPRKVIMSRYQEISKSLYNSLGDQAVETRKEATLTIVELNFKIGDRGLQTDHFSPNEKALISVFVSNLKKKRLMRQQQTMRKR
eukprot:CAMPEP_0118705060 /NCGR_PEP_ID=MMETSP0800-20121206/19636_1 /TAXON_ID=210618 ORGANISM="Striatella unipunctata, Strain CCMP2910" /NCGR_SAMPLE_ID=MMETSP0800 /ASSEMBLY_ACC=CAM_ASM_000638 /LENGTH=485 /DNA_ID=CAMNT_0006607129 /DNA_START=93 /DNA_END=1550 /DNA_ORIENTATION=-